MTDTLVVAFALESSNGIAIVLLVLGCAAVATIAALFVFSSSLTFVDATSERIASDPRVFVAMLVSLVAVPGAIVAVGL